MEHRLHRYNLATWSDPSKPRGVAAMSLLPYYVYELKDPADFKTFYVGKGQRDRIDGHDSDLAVSSELDAEKIRKIQQIRARDDNNAILKVIIGRFETEEEALAVEATLIKWVYGLGHLTNKVQGHRSTYIRPNGAVTENISGIDREKKAFTYDGSYRQAQVSKITENRIEEKLESLSVAIRIAIPNLEISNADVSNPQDPCVWVSGFSSVARLQVKMQLTGKKVVVNLRPFRRDVLGRKAFADLMDRSGFGSSAAIETRGYVQAFDFTTNAEGMAGGQYQQHRKNNKIVPKRDQICAQFGSLTPFRRGRLDVRDLVEL